MRDVRRHREEPFLLALHVVPARQLVPGLALVARLEGARRLGAGVNDRLAAFDRISERVDVIDIDTRAARFPAVAEIGAEENAAAMNARINAAMNRLDHHRADMAALEQRIRMTPFFSRRALSTATPFAVPTRSRVAG